MSIASELWNNLFRKKIGFQAAVAVAAPQLDNWLKNQPGASQAVSDALGSFKQAASNALAWADDEAAAHMADAAAAVQVTADALVMKLTGGGAAPAIPLMNNGIKQAFAALHAVLDHAEASAQAALVPPVAPAVPVTPVQVAA